MGDSNMPQVQDYFDAQGNILPEKLSEKGTRKLLRAILQQYVNDGQPKAGRDGIELYARIMKEAGLIKTYNYYKQGVVRLDVDCRTRKVL